MTRVCRTTADVFLSPDGYLASSGHSPFVGELTGAGRTRADGERTKPTHTGQIAFSKPVTQPDSDFATWSADKRPLDTAPIGHERTFV